MVYSEENVESSIFRRDKKVAIVQSGEPCVPRSLAIVPRQMLPQSFIDAFVDQNAHLGAGEQKVFRFFKGGQRRLARDGGEALQKIFNGFATFQVIEESLDRHSCSAEDWSSPEDIFVLDDDVHDWIVPRMQARGRRGPPAWQIFATIT